MSHDQVRDVLAVLRHGEVVSEDVLEEFVGVCSGTLGALQKQRLVRLQQPASGAQRAQWALTAVGRDASAVCVVRQPVCWLVPSGLIYAVLFHAAKSRSAWGVQLVAPIPARPADVARWWLEQLIERDDAGRQVSPWVPLGFVPALTGATESQVLLVLFWLGVMGFVERQGDQVSVTDLGLAFVAEEVPHAAAA